MTGWGGRVRVQKQVVEGNDPHRGHGRVSFLIPSSFYSHLPAYEDGTDRVF